MAKVSKDSARDWAQGVNLRTRVKGHYQAKDFEDFPGGKWWNSVAQSLGLVVKYYNDDNKFKGFKWIGGHPILDETAEKMYEAWIDYGIEHGSLDPVKFGRIPPPPPVIPSLKNWKSQEERIAKIERFLSKFDEWEQFEAEEKNSVDESVDID